MAAGQLSMCYCSLSPSHQTCRTKNRDILISRCGMEWRVEMQLEPRCIRIYFVHSGVVVVQVLVNREFQIGPINFVPIHYLTTSAAVVVSIDWKCGIKQAIRLNVVLSIRSPECPSCSLSPSIQTHTHTHSRGTL